MGAGDLQTKTIRHPSWDKGEEVVIKEMTFAEATKLNSAAMGNVSMADMEDEEKKKQLKMDLLDASKMQVGTLRASIVSWTLTRGGKVMKLGTPNIELLRGWYGDFIMEEIGKFNPEPDAKFPATSGDGVQGEGKVSL